MSLSTTVKSRYVSGYIPKIMGALLEEIPPTFTAPSNSVIVLLVASVVSTEINRKLYLWSNLCILNVFYPHGN